MRSRLTYANLVSTLALFLVLGGGAYAATTITGKDVKNESLTGADIRNESVHSKDVDGLSAHDFANGELPAGERGPKGDAGAPGAPGAPGAAGPSGPGARATANGQSIPSGVITPLDLSTESFDTGGLYTAPADQMTIVVAGTYLVHGELYWANSDPDGKRRLFIEVNGTALAAVGDDGTGVGLGPAQSATAVLRLQAGDVVRISAFQDSGSALSTEPIGGAGYGQLALQWLAA